MSSAVQGATDDISEIILGEANQILNTQARSIEPGAADRALDVAKRAELSNFRK
jgi:hypothetical protein